MSSPPKFVQVLVVEPDAEVARAVARLAIETVGPEPTLLVGAASTLEGAWSIIDHAVRRDDARLVVLCATQLGDGDSGLPVVDHAARTHRDVRVVLITNGERDEILHGVRRGVDGIVAKPIALPALRSILRHVVHEPERRAPPVPEDARDAALAEARDALESALDAVETAESRLREAGAEAPDGTRAAVRDARRLAAEAYRRVLEADRGSGHRAPAG